VIYDTRALPTKQTSPWVRSDSSLPPLVLAASAPAK